MGKLFSGNLRIAPCDSKGVLTGGFIGLLNPIKFEIVQPAPQFIDQIDKSNGNYGNLKDRKAVKKPPSLNISTDDVNDKRLLAYALNGTVRGFTQAAAVIAAQAGGNITDEAVVAVALGTPIQLANKQVSAVVVKNSAGSTTYTVGTDYTVNAAAGTVTPKAGGTITAAQNLKISYTAAAISAETVTAPVQPGDWVKLANYQVSGVVITDSTGATTYSPVTDYSVDAFAGMIAILPGSAITAGSTLKVSYAAAALTGTRLFGSSIISNYVRVEIDCEDIGDGTRGYFKVPIYQCVAAGNLDLVAAKLLEAALTGGMLLPQLGTAAYNETLNPDTGFACPFISDFIQSQ